MQREVDRGTVFERTSWPRVALVCLIGVTVALQIGKVPGQLPTVERELNLSLVENGLVLSIFSLIAAVGGIFVGALSARFGAVRQVMTGLALGGVATFAGSFATNGVALLASRVVEGLGFILATAATPTLIVGETRMEDRGRALGLWSMYMPAGMSAMMIVAALIGGAAGWRGVWRLTALCNLGYAIVVWSLFRGRTASSVALNGVPARLAELFATALAPGPLLLAGCFVAYAGNFLALTGFLPLMLERSGEASAASAGFLAAFVVAANMLGNAASGFIAERGFPRPLIIATSAAIMGLCAIGVFVDALPFVVRYVLALLFAGIGGIIPGTCFGAAQSLAANPSKAGPIFGALIQGAGIGQLAAPPLVAKVVEAVGSWRGAALFIGVAAVANVALALALQRVMRNR
jgi:MFS family permease